MGRRSSDIGRVYALCHPDTGEIRYVGKTTEIGRDRLLRHMRESVRSRLWVANWIRSLGGREPEFRVLEVTTREGAGECEIRWIKRLRGEGCRLTNLTDGGDGHLGHSPSIETRKKIGAAHKGKVVSVETRNKLSIAARKRAPRFRSPEEKRASTLRLLSYKKTPDDNSKMANSQRLRLAKPEVYAHQCEVLKRARAARTPESARKTSETRRKFFANNPEAKERQRAILKRVREEYLKRKQTCLLQVQI